MDHKENFLKIIKRSLSYILVAAIALIQLRATKSKEVQQ